MAKYVKGLNKDAAPIDQPEGSYRYAKNMIFNETAGAMSNEPGNQSRGALLDNDELVLGSIETTEDTVILFTVDAAGESKIYLYDPTNDTQTLAVRTTAGNVLGGSDVDLKFSKKYPIEGTYKIDPNGDLIIYFTDNLNPPRSLNVTRQINSLNFPVWIYGVNPIGSPNKNYIDRLNLFPHAGPVPSISFTRISSGGALKSGTYYLFLAYVDENFTQTNYVSYSLGVPIVEDVEAVLPIERYDGCPADSQTGKSIVWTVRNLNTDYEFLRPVVVSRVGGVEKAYRLNDVDISGTTKTITFSLLEGYEGLSVEEVIVDTVAYDTAKTLAQLDGVLYIGNLTGSKDIGFQRYANNIRVSSIVHTFDNFDPYEISPDNLDFGYLETSPLNASKDGGYRSMDNLSSAINQRRGYTRDEVYAFYIAFILNDGSMSYAYHIPGREPFTNDASTGILTPDTDGNVINNIGTDAASSDIDDQNNTELEFFNNTYDPEITTLTAGQGQFFHFYDFSSGANSNDMAFWHNQNEFYPQTDDYLVFDDSQGGQIGDLRGSNVRHHHMPSNANPDRSMIAGNINTFDGSTTTVVQRYYLFGEGIQDQNGSNFDLENTGGIGDIGTASFDDAFVGAGQGIAIDIATANNGQMVTVTEMNALVANGASLSWGWDVTQAAGDWKWGGTLWLNDGVLYEGDSDDQANGPDAYNCTGVDPTNTNSGGNSAYIIWTDVETEEINSSGNIDHEVRALGVTMDQIRVPQSIANKVQGFRIYYAERAHSNRRVLGQDLIKNTGDIDQVDLSGCGAFPGSGNGAEDFIQAAGSLYNGTVSECTFHDFYMLHAGSTNADGGGVRKSLSPATHTNYIYEVDMRSFIGPANWYSEKSPTEASDDKGCYSPDSYVAFHVGLNYTAASDTFLHYPLREKCRTFLNGDSIYDGRSLGFGKRVYNIGGESSILLGYLQNRRPNQGGWTSYTGNPAWHDNPSVDSNTSQFPGGSDFPVLQLHNLCAFKTDMYLAFDTQELVWTGYEVVGEDFDRFILNEDNSLNGDPLAHTTGDIWGGDTFICRHGYRITHRPSYDGAEPRDHKSVIYTICESTDNINFRHEEDKSTSYFPGSPLKRALDLEAQEDLTDVDNMKYNKDYSLGVADVKPPIPYPLRESDPDTFKTRVQRSAKADNTSLIDNYRVFLALQFKDLPRNRGSLHKLVSLNNLLYLHTQDSLFKTKGKQSLQLADGTESFVGGGDIFQQEPDELVQTKYGYGGTQSQWVSLVTKHGYLCMDYRNRRIFLMKDQMYDISKSGLENWFQDNIPYALERYGLPIDFDNPIVGIGFHAEYDERYDRIIITKRDKKPTDALIDLLNNAFDNIPNSTQSIAVYSESEKSFIKQSVTMGGGTNTTVLEFNDTEYFTDSGWTISYDVELNVWVSFHDYIPYKYTRAKDVLVSFLEGNSIRWGHESEGNRGRFYGVDYASEFEFIYNSAKDSDKIFYSFEYTIDVTDEHAPTIDGGKLRHDHGFNSFYVYTTHQLSGETPIEYMVNTRRVGNEWKINKFRDMAALFNNQQLTYVGPAGVGTFTGSNFGVTGANVAGTITTGVTTHLANTSMFTVDGMNETINAAFINLAKSWDQQRKFRDKWVGIRLKYDNVSKKLINLYSTNVAAKKFYR
jgi:hypothetical protein